MKSEELIELLRFVNDNELELDTYDLQHEFKVLIDNGLIETSYNDRLYVLSKRGKIVVDGILAYASSCCAGEKRDR